MGNKRIFGTIRVGRILSALLLWQLLAMGVLPYVSAPLAPASVSAVSRVHASRVASFIYQYEE